MLWPGEALETMERIWLTKWHGMERPRGREYLEGFICSQKKLRFCAAGEEEPPGKLHTRDMVRSACEKTSLAAS